MTPLHLASLIATAALIGAGLAIGASYVLVGVYRLAERFVKEKK